MKSKIGLGIATLLLIVTFNNCGAFRATKALSSSSFNSTDLDKVCQTQKVDTPVYSGLRRLSRGEYRNSIRDLLGVTPPLDVLPQDTKVGFFDNNAAAMGVSSIFLNAMIDVSDSIVTQAIATNKATIFTCTTNSVACASQIILPLTRKAYHRKTTTDDVNSLVAVWQRSISSGDSFDEAIKVMIRALISSPDFLYRYVDAKGGAPLCSLHLALGQKMGLNLPSFGKANYDDAQSYNKPLSGL